MECTTKYVFKLSEKKEYLQNRITYSVNLINIINNKGDILYPSYKTSNNIDEVMTDYIIEQSIL